MLQIVLHIEQGILCSKINRNTRFYKVGMGNNNKRPSKIIMENQEFSAGELKILYNIMCKYGITVYGFMGLYTLTKINSLLNPNEELNEGI